MPRKARKYLSTSYIHVMVQGINKEYIFDCERYQKTYLNYIMDIKTSDKFSLLAYCMMNNHAHFLFWVDDFSSFEKYMHKNNLKFAQKLNREKNRCGVVFRNRYQVEPIYDISHLKNCIKYIHNNPVKANMVKRCEDYKYSSYNEYIKNVGVATDDRLKAIFGVNANYLDIFNDTYERRFLDIDNNEKDEEYITSGIYEFTRKTGKNIIQIFSDRNILTEMIVFLKKECNIHYTETMRYLGVTNGVSKSIQKSIKNKNYDFGRCPQNHKKMTQ